MKPVILTGVSRGLGLAMAERLAAHPDYSVLGLSRTLSPAYQALIDAHPGKVHFRSFDIGDLDAIGGLVKDLVSQHGVPWGLINNAAVGVPGILGTMHKTDIDMVLRVNLTAPITLCKYVSRVMMKRREGRIINVSSIIASTGFHALSVYGASKAGLVGLTKSLSRELGKVNITVNCLAPGFMATEMTDGFDDGQMASIRRRAPLGLPEVQDVAGAALYLLGPDAGKVTGTVMTIDGGSTA